MSEASFQRAIAFILPHEEEFARGHWGDENFVIAENVSGDNGGLTKYGIDAKSHPGVDIARLDKPAAVAIYRQEWNWRNLDLLPDLLAVAAFDVYVNGGDPIAWLQHAWNATNPDGPTLMEDGELGPHTLSALAICDQPPILKIFIEERNARFERLAARNPQYQKFLAGWEQRDTDLAKYLAVT
jgi:lysozyme family protein